MGSNGQGQAHHGTATGSDHCPLRGINGIICPAKNSFVWQVTKMVRLSLAEIDTSMSLKLILTSKSPSSWYLRLSTPWRWWFSHAQAKHSNYFVDEAAQSQRGPGAPWPLMAPDGPWGPRRSLGDLQDPIVVELLSVRLTSRIFQAEIGGKNPLKFSLLRDRPYTYMVGTSNLHRFLLHGHW